MNKNNQAIPDDKLHKIISHAKELIESEDWSYFIDGVKQILTAQEGECGEPKKYDVFGLVIREGDDRQIAIDVGAEFVAWAINHQDESKYVGVVMNGAWWKWLDRELPAPPKEGE